MKMHNPRRTIVILVGPPNSGKDTIAAYISATLGYKPASFKAPLLAIAEILVPKDIWRSRFNDRELKDEPWDYLNGHRCRDLLIAISEQAVKPILGTWYFGYMAAAKLEPDCDYVFSDGGFQEEIKAVRDATHHTHRLVIIQLRRDGCSYKHDSRTEIGGMADAEYWRVWNRENQLDSTFEHIRGIISGKI